VVLTAADGKVRGDAPLLEPPQGKVCRLQASCVNAEGVRVWGPAQTVAFDRELVVERKPALLQFKPQRGAGRTLDFKTAARFRLGDEDDPDEEREMTTTVQLKESVETATTRGATLALRYATAERVLSEGPPDRRRETPSKILPRIRPALAKVQAALSLDAEGNPTANTVAPASLAGLTKETAAELEKFHEPTQYGLEALAVRLPNETTKPGAKWTAVRTLPIVTGNRFEKGKIDITYTYLGRRRHGGRDEAVIALEGVVRGFEDRESKLAGSASGTAVVDLASGEVLHAQTVVGVDMELVLEGAGDGLKVALTMDMELKRSGP
jgi:hypothetical protein